MAKIPIREDLFTRPLEPVGEALRREGVRGINFVFNLDGRPSQMSNEKIENKLRTLRLNIRKEVEKLSDQGYAPQDLHREAGLPVEYLPEPDKSEVSGE